MKVGQCGNTAPNHHEAHTAQERNNEHRNSC